MEGTQSYGRKEETTGDKERIIKSNPKEKKKTDGRMRLKKRVQGKSGGGRGVNRERRYKEGKRKHRKGHKLLVRERG